MADTQCTEQPVFQEFEWNDTAEVSAKDVTVPGYVFARLANRTRDICSGVATVLALLESDALRKQDSEPDILNAQSAGNLFRLANQSANMLSEEAEEAMAWAYKYRTAQGRESALRAR